MLAIKDYWFCSIGVDIVHLASYNLSVMPIRGNLHRSTGSNISNSPRDIGVYALYRRELIYIGRADGQGGIRSRLQAHRRGDEGRCTQRANSYRCERHRDPSAREAYLLEEFYERYGRLPRCNERIG